MILIAIVILIVVLLFANIAVAILNKIDPVCDSNTEYFNTKTDIKGLNTVVAKSPDPEKPYILPYDLELTKREKSGTAMTESYFVNQRADFEAEMSGKETEIMPKIRAQRDKTAARSTVRDGYVDR